MKKADMVLHLSFLQLCYFYFGFEYMHRKCKYTGFGDTENAVGKWSG